MTVKITLSFLLGWIAIPFTHAVGLHYPTLP